MWTDDTTWLYRYQVITIVFNNLEKLQSPNGAKVKTVDLLSYYSQQWEKKDCLYKTDSPLVSCGDISLKKTNVNLMVAQEEKSELTETNRFMIRRHESLCKVSQWHNRQMLL